MRQRHQVGLRRQLVGGMSPVTVGENAQLSAFDEGLDALLHVREIARRGSRVGRTHGLCQRRGGFGIGIQRRDHVHPIQRVQVIEMHHMVVHELRRDHQVADQLRVGRHLIFQRVFHRAHRGDAMHQRAHAADALRERPCVARVAAAQNDFDAAHHGAGTGSARDAVVRIGFRLDAQMAFDAGDRVDDDALCCGHIRFLICSEIPPGCGIAPRARHCRCRGRWRWFRRCAPCAHASRHPRPGRRRVRQA